MSKFAGESVLLLCYGSRGLITKKSVCFSLIFFCHGWGRIFSFHANSLLWRVPWLLPHIVSSRPCSNSDPLYHSFTSALVLSTFLPAYNILRPLPFWNHLLALHSRDHPTPIAPNIKCFQRIVYMSSPPDHNLLTCYLLLPFYFVANLTTTNSLLAAKLKWKLLLSIQHLSLWPSCLFLNHSPLLIFTAALLWFSLYLFSLLPMKHSLDTTHSVNTFTLMISTGHWQTFS